MIELKPFKSVGTRMKKHNLELEWKNNVLFNISNGKHSITIDGGTITVGFSPKPLMLAAFAGCTAVDVVLILKEMNVEFKDFKVFIEGELGVDKPQTYTKVHLIYNFYGLKLNKEKIKKAVFLSVDEQCGVIKMFNKFSEVSYEIKFDDA